jgi:pimeloyl-ACP methyl ester carboxylesterase
VSEAFDGAAVVVGYDIGSRIAQAFAKAAPDRVSRLVLSPPLPGIGDRVLTARAQAEFWYQAFHQLPLADTLIDGRENAVRAYLTHFWEHWSAPGWSPPAEHIAALVTRYAAPGAFTASIAWYRGGAGAVAHSLREEPPTERLATPTSVLWPEHDPLFPLEWSDRLDQFFADVELRPVPQAGHFVPLEAPDALVDAIRDRL